MAVDGLDVGYPRAVLVALLLATVLGLGVAASTSTASFSLYNARWDGAADLEAVADDPNRTVEVLQSTASYAAVPPNESVAVVLSPDDPYTDVERRRIRTFVRDGGTLVVAEDYHRGGNRLLAAVGARARIDGRTLRDERFSTRSPAFPVAGNVSGHPLARGVDRLTLNHGSAVRPNGATVLVRTSAYAYLDANGNGALDTAETMERRPVATVESVGRGRVIVAGDPSLFINAMLERRGNRRFAENVLDEPTVLLDYSHAGDLPPLAAFRLRLRNAPLWQGVLGLIGVALIGAWGRWDREASDEGGVRSRVRTRFGRGPVAGRRRSSRVDDDRTLRAALAERHPDRDDDHIRRVTEGIMAGRDKRQRDD